MPPLLTEVTYKACHILLALSLLIVVLVCLILINMYSVVAVFS